MAQNTPSVLNGQIYVCLHSFVTIAWCKRYHLMQLVVASCKGSSTSNDVAALCHETLHNTVQGTALQHLKSYSKGCSLLIPLRDACQFGKIEQLW